MDVTPERRGTGPAHDLAELADLVLAVARALQARQGAEGVVPLTATEAAVLRHLDRHPGDSPSAVADALALQRSNLSTALRTLEAKGLVERAHGRDGRSVAVRPTALADASVARLRDHWAAVLAGAAADPGEVRAAVAVLARVDAALHGRTVGDPAGERSAQPQA
ncbi:MarR family winged helix-turn-helix transcriptional regulator [Cellulomonas sp. NPDC057328]|uniref:MarR family winged helix-turn-helix transcriptional regulator n=1 Tax=Cellulomonas sp. NPDC057328 TaxID=3346101 RepID=UPI0036345CF8